MLRACKLDCRKAIFPSGNNFSTSRTSMEYAIFDIWLNETVQN